MSHVERDDHVGHRRVVYPPVRTLPPNPTQWTGTSSASKKVESLISRYQLEERVQTGESIPEAELKLVGGKATWEDNPERREASLRERKATMVLAARQSFLAQEQGDTGDKTSAINVGDSEVMNDTSTHKCSCCILC